MILKKFILTISIFSLGAMGISSSYGNPLEERSLKASISFLKQSPVAFSRLKMGNETFSQPGFLLQIKEHLKRIEKNLSSPKSLENKKPSYSYKKWATVAGLALVGVGLGAWIFRKAGKEAGKEKEDLKKSKGDTLIVADPSGWTKAPDVPPEVWHIIFDHLNPVNEHGFRTPTKDFKNLALTCKYLHFRVLEVFRNKGLFIMKGWGHPLTPKELKKCISSSWLKNANFLDLSHVQLSPLLELTNSHESISKVIGEDVRNLPEWKQATVGLKVEKYKHHALKTALDFLRDHYLTDVRMPREYYEENFSVIPPPPEKEKPEL